MLQIHLFFLFCFFFSHLSLLPALPDLPDPVPIQPFAFPTSPPSTIPAFPEQSDVGGSCPPLDFPDELFQGMISRACPSSHLSRSRCCPALAAWFYSAYSATALAAGRAIRPPRSADLPVLPDDSEACVDGVEKALRARGVALGRVNDTCDVAYCYCGVRLRPLVCPGGLAVEKDGEGRWVAKDDKARRIERVCSQPGLAGCSRCLRSLYQLKGEEEGEQKSGKLWRNRDCQLTGLTWLLAKNRTLYLPTVTRVLRAFLMSPGGADPLSCTLAHDGMPLAVDSAELDDHDPDSSSSPSWTVRSLFLHFCWSSCSAVVVLVLLLLWSSE